MMFSLMFFT